jgi:hypothetical protein
MLRITYAKTLRVNPKDQCKQARHEGSYSCNIDAADRVAKVADGRATQALTKIEYCTDYRALFRGEPNRVCVVRQREEEYNVS